jgi:hypothetical protein
VGLSGKTLVNAVATSGLKEIWKDGHSRLSTELHLLTYCLRSVNAASSKYKKTFVTQMSVNIEAERNLECSLAVKAPLVIVAAFNVRCAAPGTKSSFSAAIVASWMYAQTVTGTVSDGFFVVNRRYF